MGSINLLSFIALATFLSSALSINTVTSEIFFTEKISEAVIRTQGRGARSKYAIHCAMRPPPNLLLCLDNEVFVFVQHNLRHTDFLPGDKITTDVIPM